MDVVMPELDGILATRQILKVVPDQLVIVLTGVDDEDDELGLLALRAGAAGFLSKDVDIDALPRTLEAVRAGEAAISRRMTKRVIEQLRSAPGGSSGMRPVKSPLTAREWEVIDLLKATRSTDEIAADLVLSTETVRSHVKNILRKLDVRSREEAVAAADRMRNATPPIEDPGERESAGIRTNGPGVDAWVSASRPQAQAHRTAHPALAETLLKARLGAGRRAKDDGAVRVRIRAPIAPALRRGFVVLIEADPQLVRREEHCDALVVRITACCCWRLFILASTPRRHRPRQRWSDICDFWNKELGRAGPVPGNRAAARETNR